MATKSWLDEIEWLEDEEEKSTSLPKPASWLNEIDWEDKEDKVAELETLSQKPSWLNGVEWLEEEPTKPVARRPLVSPRAPTLESMGVTAMEETMPEESFLRPFADPLLNIGAGINDVVKGFSDAFGADNAVSQNLAKNSEWYRSLLSAGAKQDQEEIGRIMQEAEGQGVLAEIGAGLKALTVAPVDLVSQGIGSLIPFIATAGVGKAVGLSKAGIAVLQGVQGGVVGGGIVKGEIYNAVKDQLINSGVDEDKAEKAAQEAQAYNGKNLDQIFLGIGLGVAASTTGADSAIRSLISRKVGKQAAEQVSEQAIQEVLRTGFVRGALKDGTMEFVTEGLQGGQERLAANIAVGREGFDVEPMRGVVGQATLEGAIGSVLGGGAGGVNAKVEQMDARQKVALRDAQKAAEEAKQSNAPASAAAVEEQINQTIEETPDEKVARLQREAQEGVGIELEEEPPVSGLPPVEPTPAVTPPVEAAVAPVEPVVPVVGAVEPTVTEVAPEPAEAVAPTADEVRIALASGVEVFHGGKLPDQITEVRAFGGLHAGTEKAAQERIGRPSMEGEAADVTKMVVTAQNPYLPEGRILDETDGTDRTQLFLIQQLPEERQKLIDAGYDVVPYKNAIEDPNSVSYLILDPRGYTREGDRYIKAAPEAAPAAVEPTPVTSTPVTPEVPTAEPPALAPLRRVVKAEQTEEDVSGLVGQGLVELYKGQPVITQAGLEALPEAERPRLTPKARKMKEPATMTAGEVNKELDRLRAESSQITQEFIAAGRGNERPSEYLKKTDPLSVRAKESADRMQAVRDEVRLRYGTDVSTLPTGRRFGPRARPEPETPPPTTKEGEKKAEEILNKQVKQPSKVVSPVVPTKTTTPPVTTPLQAQLLPSDQADKADAVLAVSKKNNYYTLWFVRQFVDGKPVKNSFQYLTILSTDPDEAVRKADAYGADIVGGKSLSVAFAGKNLQNLQGAKTIAILPEFVEWDQLSSPLRGAAAGPIGQQTVGFGKYSGVKVDDLYAKDSNYVDWLMSTNPSSKRVRDIVDYLRTSSPELQLMADARELEGARIRAYEERESRRKGGEQVPVTTLVRREGQIVEEAVEQVAPKPKAPKLTGRKAKDQMVDIVAPRTNLPDRVASNLKPQMYPIQVDGANAVIESMDRFNVALNGDGAGVGKTRQIIAVAEHYAKQGKPVVIVTENAAIGKPWEGRKTPILGGSMAKDSEAMGVTLNLLTETDKPADNGSISITTYNRVTTQNIPTGAIVIFDESQNLANTFGAMPDERAGTELGQWQIKFRDIFGRAERTAFYSATPADKPHQLAYLYKVLGFNSPEEYLSNAVQNGTVIKTRRFGSIEQKYYDVPSGKNRKATLYKWVNGIMTEAGNIGRFIKREISYEGTDVQFHDVKGTDLEKNPWAKPFLDALAQMASFQAQGYLLLAPNSYVLYGAELTKIGDAVRIAKRELDAGRKIVIYFSRINDLKIRGRMSTMGMDGRMELGEPVDLGIIPSPVVLLRDELKKEGIKFTELHGKSGTTSQKAQKEFAGPTNVLLASVESGGTGINLDDTTGNEPRTEIFMFSPYRGISTIQAMGRIWRASTIQDDNKPNRFVFATASDIDADASRSAVLAKKLQLMNASLGGTAVSRLPMSKTSYDPSQLVGIELPEEGVESAAMAERTGVLMPVNIKWSPTRKGGFYAKATADLLEWVERGGADRTGINVSVFKSRDSGDWVALADKEYKPEDFVEKPEPPSPQPEARESRRAIVTPQQDRDYLDAVERGDLDAASRVVENAAKPATHKFIDASVTQSQRLRWVASANKQINFWEAELKKIPTKSQATKEYQELVKAWNDAGLGRGPEDVIRGIMELKLQPPPATLEEYLKTRIDLQKIGAEKELEKAKEILSRTPAGRDKTQFKTGEPTVVKVYHSTPFGRLTEFSDEMLGAFTGAPSATKAHFFAGSPDVSETYYADSSWLLNHKGFFQLSPDQKKDLISSARESLPNGLESTSEEIAELAESLFDIDNYNTDPVENVRHDVFVRLDNPLVYDFRGAGYREVSFNDLLIQAEQGGHDGVIMANTTDAGPAATIDSFPEPVNIVAVLRGHSDQIKLADPVTYDDQGNPIPPSQRFQQGEADIRYNPLGYDITNVVEDIKAGRTDGPLRAVNNVVKEATALRDRVKAEADRRQRPRARGKAAILERIARERSSGKLSEETAQALTDFVNSIREEAIGDTAISIKGAGGASNFDFGQSLVNFFLTQDQPKVGARVGIHEFWHGLSRFLPKTEAEKMAKDYTQALSGYLKDNPWFLAFVGRYSLTPEQFEEYKLFNPKEAETKLVPVQDSQGNIVKYQIKYDAENYRYIMLDEWIAEKMTDLVESRQAMPNTFMGKLAKIIKEFLAQIQAKLGRDVYQSFYNLVTDPNQKIDLQRMGGVARPFQIYQPQDYNYAEDISDQIRYAMRQRGDINREYTPNTDEERKAFEKATSNKVLARNPQLAVAAVRLKNGQITAGEYADLVDSIDPFVPKGADPIPTDDKIKQYIQSDKVGKVGFFDANGNPRLEDGSEYEFRIDINTYNRSTAAGDTVYNITAHLPVSDTSKNIGEVAAFTGIAKVTDPRFMTRDVREGGAITIATGAGKFRLATVKGNYEPITDLPADINDPNVWTEVGYNPVRSSFFVDTRSKQAVVGGSEAIMVGSRVFVKNAQLEARPTGITYGKAYNPLGLDPEPTPLFAIDTPEAKTLSNLKASMEKVDSASESKGGKPETQKVSEIAANWMESGGDERALQDAITENTNLSPTNAAKVAKVIAKQYGLQQQIAETGAVIAEIAPEAEGAPRKSSVTKLIEQTTGVRKPVVKLQVSESAALKKQIQLKAREARETRKARKEAAEDLAKSITDYVKANPIRGPINSRQAMSITKKALKLDVNNEAAVDRFEMYVERVIENANYDRDLADARALIKKAKTLSKSSTTQANVKTVLDLVAAIPPALLDNPFEFNLVVQRYLLGLAPVTAKKYAVMPDADVTRYLQSLEPKIKENQDTLNRARAQRILDKQASYAEEEGIPLDEAIAILNSEEFLTQKTISKLNDLTNLLTSMAQESQKDVNSYDDSGATAKQKELISYMRKVGLDSLSNEEKKRYIRFSNNLMANGATFGMEQFQSIALGQEAAIEASKDKRLSDKMAAWITPFFGDKAKETARKIADKTQSESDTLKNIFGREAVGAIRKLLGLNRLDLQQTKSTKAKAEIADETGEYYKGLKKKYGEDATGFEAKGYAGVAGYLIQREGDKTQEESIAYRRRLFEQNIVELRKSDIQDDLTEADLKERALSQLTGASNSEILSQLKALNPASYEQLMWWKDTILPKWRPFLKEHDENFNNQANNYNNPDHLTISYRFREGQLLPKEIEEAYSRDPIGMRIKQAANSIKRKEHQSLPVSPKSGVIANIDINFGYNQYSALVDQVDRAYVTPAWEQVVAFTNSPEFEPIMGGRANAAFVRKMLTDIQVARGRQSMTDDEAQMVAGGVRLARKMATQAVLGGFTQPLRQVGDQLWKLVTTSGRLDLIKKNLLSIGDGAPLMDKFPIGRRGDAQAGTQYASTYSELSRRVEAAVTDRNWAKYRELMNKVGEFWMTPLRASDVWVAKVSWMTYYEAYLNKQGIKMESWQREAELVETDSVRKDAAAQAEFAVDFYGGASDPTKMASLSKQSNNGWKEFAKLTFLPLNSFALQQKNALISDMRDAFLRTGDRKAAIAGIAGTLGGMAIFHGTRIALIGGLVYPAGKALLMGVFGIDMDEPDEEEKQKQLEDGWRKFKASMYGNIVAGGAGQFIENGMIDAFNRTAYLWQANINPDELLDEDGEIMSFGKYEKEVSPLYRFRSYGSSEYTFGLADVLTEQAERSFVATQQIMDPEEMERYTGNEQAYALFSTGVQWAYFFRLMDTDVTRIAVGLKRDMDKGVEEREKEIKAIRSGR
jgi:hypothetical protein